MRSLLASDSAQVVWWETRVECVSALAKKTRQGVITSMGEAQARVALLRLISSWSEVLPSDQLRAYAEYLIDQHPLTTVDAMQLASAALWRAYPSPYGNEFVCLDRQLGNAAKAEGFTVIP